MSVFQRGDIWWYEFWFTGRRIRESSKPESKTGSGANTAIHWAEEAFANIDREVDLPCD